MPTQLSEDLEEWFDNDPYKALEIAQCVPHLEDDQADTKDLLKDARSKLEDSMDNKRITQKQTANTQKMYNGYRNDPGS